MAGVCISTTLRLVYRHLLHQPRRSSANTIARHTYVASSIPFAAPTQPSESDTHQLIVIREMQRRSRGSEREQNEENIERQRERRREERRIHQITLRTEGRVTRIVRDATIPECDEPSLTSACGTVSDQTSLFDTRLHCSADGKLNGVNSRLNPRQGRGKASSLAMRS